MLNVCKMIHCLCLSFPGLVNYKFFKRQRVYHKLDETGRGRAELLPDEQRDLQMLVLFDV